MDKELSSRNSHSFVSAKIAAVLLVLVCTLALTGCSDGEFSMEALMAWPFGVDSDEEAAEEEAADEEAAEEEEADAADDAAEEEEAADEEAAEEEEEEAEGSQSIDEVVLFDESGVSMTATGVGADEYGGAYIEVTIENDSDLTVEVYSNEDFSAGDVMTDAWLYETVTPGKTAYSQIEFDGLSSIDELVDVEGSFMISDEESYDVIAEPSISFSVE